MSETLVELAETDALLTAISRGTQLRTGDPTLDALSGWVEEITSHPVPRVEMELPEFYQREASGRGWRIAATAVVVTAMSSSGIAAAAIGDPLAPFSYVATALGHLAPSDRADENSFGGLPRGLDPGARSRESDRASDAVTLQPFGSYSSAQTHGRHRADDSETSQPRHRATTAGQLAPQEQSVDGYTPTHVATGVGTEAAEPPTATPTPPSSPPADTPSESTPPVDTPADPTPPTPPAPTDPSPVPGDGPVVGGGGPVEAAPPADSGATGGPEAVGSGSGAVADQAVVRVSDPAPADQTAP